MTQFASVDSMVGEIRGDLTSGAAELALRAINVYRTVLGESSASTETGLRQNLTEASRALLLAHPAMAPIFTLANDVLFAMDEEDEVDGIKRSVDEALTRFESRLCQSAANIAERTYDLIPPGELVFAYSFSTTVVSSLLHARAKKKFFRAVCSEARPSFEGRKLSAMLAASGMEVTHTFDSAMGLFLPSCAAAFMGVDCVGRPGLVNKVGSWLLALACRELGIPLYALAGTEKFVPDDVLFSFEDHERPGSEVWDDPPAGVRVLNKQFELIPFSWIAGLVTDEGILKEADIETMVNRVRVHKFMTSHYSLV